MATLDIIESLKKADEEGFSSKEWITFGNSLCDGLKEGLKNTAATAANVSKEFDKKED